MKNTAPPTVSLIVPVHDGGESFMRCLSSLKELKPAPEEVIIVDDASRDGSGEKAEEAGFRVLRTGERGGPARARNIGAAAAEGGVLFFIDSDVAVPNQAVGQVRSAFEKDISMAALFGSYDDAPSEPNFLSQYKNLFHHFTHQISNREASTFWAGCGAVRRAVFLQLGGFDEGYRSPAVEDIELGYRMRKGGFRIRLLKSLQVKHLKHWGFRSLLASEVFDRAVPWTRLILRDRFFIKDLNLRMRSRFSVASAWLALAALAMGFVQPWALAAAGGFLLLPFLLNLPLYRFFLRKKGLRFALGALPWHWLYLLYSGLGFGIGLGQHILSKRTAPPARRLT